MMPAPADAITQLLALSAGRLLLRHIDPGLTEAAAVMFPDTTPSALARAIAQLAEQLFKELAQASNALGRIARGCGLSAFDLDLLGLAILPCLEDRAGAAVFTLAGQRRLPAGLAVRLLMGDGMLSAARAALWRSPLWRHGLLRVADATQPVTERILDPSAALLAGLDGEVPDTLPGGWIARHPAAAAPPGSLAGCIEAVTVWLAKPDAPLLHLAGETGPGTSTLVAAAAQTERRLTVFDAPSGNAIPPWRDLALIALATDRVVALAAPDTDQLPAPPADLGASLVLLAPFQAYLRPDPASALPARIVVPPRNPVEQAQAWQAALPMPAEEADALANQTWMTPADITAIARRAGTTTGIASARLATVPPRPVKMAMLRVPSVSWSDLVLEPTTQTQLEDVVRRYRLRVLVRHRWGLSRGPRGLIILLSGDTGVGKTLAAEAIASRIGLPLMAVDLSLVVSKYIGETEKNLAELFTAAEGFAALLFFDEADALFGKRTAVQDAHDRYANIEMNYLLQRIEAFDGIAVLASNRAKGLDEAFLRRFDMVILIPRPGPTQRLDLWQQHLPPDLLEPSIPLAAVADRFELTGGEIRNASLAAAYAAAGAGGQVTPILLQRAIMAEFAKKGRPAPGWPGGAP
jgi:hypothetical protein